MGAKESKQPEGQSYPPLSKSELKSLSKQTRLSRDKIKLIYDQFMLNSTNGQIDKRQFASVYQQTRRILSLQPKRLEDDDLENAFKTYDCDQNGTLTFREFLAAYFAIAAAEKVNAVLDFGFNTLGRFMKNFD